MTVNWEYLAKLAGKFFLLFLEYCIKFTAIVITGSVLAADGSIGMKLSTGFGSISQVLRQVFEVPEQINKAVTVIYDYNHLTAAAFTDSYGPDALDSSLAFINEGILYVQAVNENLVNQPFSTFFASFISFAALYSISFVIRFARHEGKGSLLSRVELKLAEKVFQRPGHIKNRESQNDPQKTVEKKFSEQSSKTNNYMPKFTNSFPKG